MRRIVVTRVLVARLGAVGALHVPADFNFANVERGAMAGQPQEVEDLRALRLRIIKQEAAAGACRQASVAVESAAGIAVIECDREWIGVARRSGGECERGWQEEARKHKVREERAMVASGTGSRHPHGDGFCLRTTTQQL